MMFENIIGQPIVERLKHDVKANTLPPSILFTGPAASAKSTAALELARVLSCEAEAEWNCQCSSCLHHKTLSHPDLLVLGPRGFHAEIAACKDVFLQEPENMAGRVLFLRAVRKLLLRFSPVLWEGDPKISKLNKLLEVITENVDIIAEQKETAPQKIEKCCKKILDNCIELEAEGVSGIIHVAHVRHGSYWLRTAPNGKRKMLIIEHAEKMNDSARNSLLKILEEPPPAASIILISSKPEALLPTILSRLRPYHFGRRSAGDEGEVLRRIFKHGEAANSSKENAIMLFLDTFLPVSKKTLHPAAAYFWSSIAASVLVMLRKKEIADKEPSETLLALGKQCAGIAEQAGMNKYDTGIKTITAAVMKCASNFETRSLFPTFLNLLCETLSQSLADRNNNVSIAYRMSLKKYIEESRTAVEVYNQTPALALERLAAELQGALLHIEEPAK